ncbi:DoxX family protein [Uliginosibacterium sp. H3]|uniref:DoxX family protein n=1 Tax=Uliginosibacterium silvisoli TaxID=3114758 RepID=A0ABU6K2Z6_9RHOO|nr:DoxX family protein [Uliginosibacterium sp. H3]
MQERGPLVLHKLMLRAAIPVAWVELLQPVLLLALRLYIGWIFMRSGLTKVDDWGTTIALFTDEYKVPLLPPALAALMGAGGELLLSPLLVLGLAGRFAALGLFVVNAMAVLSYPQLWQFECPAAIQSHFFWGALILVLAAFGPGGLSLDAWLKRRFGMA